MKDKSMLDGSGIKAAREAAGMTQLALAEKCGTRQQTIEKIELGKVKRTSYLPEIQRALGIRKQTVSERIARRIAELEKSPSSVALEAGLGRSTVRDIIVNDENPRIDTLRKLTGPLQCTLEYLTADEAPTNPPLPAIGGISPLMVLRTILCANPTAEQIEAALAANGFRIVPVEGNFPTTEIADDPKAFVLDVMHRHNLTPGALAGKVGISASTLTRAFNDPGHKFKFSVGTIQKIREWDRAETEPQRIHQA